MGRLPRVDPSRFAGRVNPGLNDFSPPELSEKQGDTLLGFSVREFSSGRMGAFGLLGVRRFPRLWICLTPHWSAVLPIDTTHAPQRGDAYQPKVQPWIQRPTRPRVLKERRKSANGARRTEPSSCGVPSERIRVSGPFQGYTLRWYASPRWGGKWKGQRRTPNRPIPSLRGKRVSVPFPGVPESKP
jgi:hypothetical protein